MKYTPFKLIGANRPNNIICICDHASNLVPNFWSKNGLGIRKSEMGRHIAYDLGAKRLTKKLSRLLNGPAILSNFSRLVIDPNRGQNDPTLIMKISDGSIIQGNKNISYLDDCEEKIKRIKSYYNTYHNKISDIINLSIKKGVFPAIISIHSFTPIFNGKKRLTELGILWDSDDRLPNIIFQYFRLNNKNINIGDNKPYSGRMKNDTLYRHGTKRGIANILIEIRQDLISNTLGQLNFAQIVSEPLLENNKNVNLFKKKIYKSLSR